MAYGPESDDPETRESRGDRNTFGELMAREPMGISRPVRHSGTDGPQPVNYNDRKCCQCAKTKGEMWSFLIVLDSLYKER
jgi:hypothetical protein